MAKAFKFRLQTVLSYRERIEEEARSRFLTIQQLQAQKEADLLRLREESAKAVDAMVDAKTGEVDIHNVRMLNRYITGLGISQMQRAGELRSISNEVEKRRIELVRARQDVKVMEKLRERKQEEHDYELGREEMRTFDEMALQGDLRRRMEAVRQVAMLRGKKRG